MLPSSPFWDVALCCDVMRRASSSVSLAQLPRVATLPSYSYPTRNRPAAIFFKLKSEITKLWKGRHIPTPNHHLAIQDEVKKMTQVCESDTGGRRGAGEGECEGGADDQAAGEARTGRVDGVRGGGRGWLRAAPLPPLHATALVCEVYALVLEQHIG